MRANKTEQNKTWPQASLQLSRKQEGRKTEKGFRFPFSLYSFRPLESVGPM